MYYKDTDSDLMPQKVEIENLPGGRRTVRLTDNVEEYTQEDAKTRKMYRFEEVVFELPASATVTAEEIETDFAEWWEYGKTDQAGKDEEMENDTPEPEQSAGMTRGELTVAVQKLQDQNEMLEACVLEMSEIVYA